MPKKKVKDTVKKVKWVRCQCCGSTDPPIIVSTDVHVTWSTTLLDEGYLRRSKSPKEISPTIESSCIVCSNCGGALADNVSILSSSDFTLVRTEGA